MAKKKESEEKSEPKGRSGSYKISVKRGTVTRMRNGMKFFEEPTKVAAKDWTDEQWANAEADPYLVIKKA